MPDVIKDEDVERLVARASRGIEAGTCSPIEIIKYVKDIEQCTVEEAKEAYSLAANNETLGEYQERVVSPLLDELELEQNKPLAKLSQSAFEKLKLAGHWFGMLLLVVGTVLLVMQQNPFFILAAFVFYWVLNYLVIRGLVESKYVSTGKSREE